MRIAPVLTLLTFSISIPFAPASILLVNSRGALSGSDSLPISTFGPEGTLAVSGTTVSTVNFNAVTVTGGGNGFSVLQQNDFWPGNFANAALVLWTGNINTLDADAGQVIFTFSAPVSGVGLQIQPDAFNTSFTASIDAFDSTNTNLGSFTENGTSTSANDNSAIFIGVVSTSADIKAIAINITSPSGLDFAFNDLTFGTAAGVPEPVSSTLLLIGSGMLTVFALRRARNPE